MSLLHTLAGAALTAPPTDVYPVPVERARFKVDPVRVSRLIGVEVDAARVRSALPPLGYEVAGDLSVSVPTHRVDVNDEVVIAEDIARMIDFDNIPTRPLAGTATRGQTSPADAARQRAAAFLVQCGWYETKNDPLESAKAAAWLGEPPPALVLANAASAEMAALRRSLLTGLVASAQRNIFRAEPSVRLFEIDRVFGGPDVQQYHISGICGGLAHAADWRSSAATDLFVLKGVLEDLLEALGVADVVARPTERKPYRAGNAAEFSAAGQSIGHFGEIDTAVLKIERQPYKLFAFELGLEAVIAARRSGIVYRPVSKLPSVQRDLAIVAVDGVSCGDLCDAIRASGGAALDAIRVVDEYRGAPVAAGSRSIALRLTFRDPSRTLTTEEVTAIVEKITAALADRYAATLRA
jgi:phenylalanyl-tRNA synthetase beta chain